MLGMKWELGSVLVWELGVQCVRNEVQRLKLLDEHGNV